MLNEKDKKGKRPKSTYDIQNLAESTESKSIKIAVFDGQVDNSWVESLTLLSNENKTHAFPNGDTIFLDHLKILLETQNLSYCSPSMVFLS